MKQVYLYDEDMMFIGEDIVEEMPENATEVKPTDSLYKAKFDGEKWIETITDEELKELNKPTVILSDTERIEALESALLELTSALL